MTGQQPNRPASPPTAGLRLDVANQAGDLWCGVCKAYTAYSADVVALRESGVAVVGAVTGCVICDDPDDPETRRG